MSELTDLTQVVRDVTDLWDEPLDEVHDVPQVVHAVLAWLPEHDHRVREQVAREIEAWLASPDGPAHVHTIFAYRNAASIARGDS